MATRSMIGTYGPEGEWLMRYCHWDGYPDGVGAELCRIVNRDGIADAIRVIVDENTHGWSSIGANTIDPPLGAGDRFATIPGYGYAYRPDEGGNPAPGDEMDAEWAYAITEHTLGTPMIDVYAYSVPDERWRLHACMDCASGRMLSTSMELTRVIVNPVESDEEWRIREEALDALADAKFDAMQEGAI